jgi:ABC-type branched-subunit amino acid transport system substrate-binding protein
MRPARWLTAFVALSLVAAACGDDDDGAAPAEGTEEPTTTTVDDLFAEDDGGDGDTADGDDPCAGVELEATDTGVSADTITVVVMADVGSELAPGLFQGSIDGARAWAEHVNATGGLACREVRLVEWDSALNPTETTNGFLEACDKALAMVGSTALFVTDTAALSSCPDGEGNPIGIADIAERAVEGAHQCSGNTFSMSSVPGACPVPGEGEPRDFRIMVGGFQWLIDEGIVTTPTTGVFLIPGDLPSTINASMPTIRAINDLGVESAGEFAVSGRAEQATYGAFIQAMRDSGATWAYSGSNDQTVIKWRKEAAAQGFDPDSVTWVCGVACYTPEFLAQGGSDVEGTYVWLPFLPFDETDSNEQLAAFIDAIGEEQPASWAAAAWAAGVLLEQVVAAIVEADGPNGVTRQAVLDAVRATDAFDADGMISTMDFTTYGATPCFAMLQVRNGAFERVYPQARGELDCSADNIVEKSLNAAAEFKG